MRLTIGRTLPASSDAVWRLITDTRAWPRWGPSVRAVECGDAIIHKDSRGRILTPLGIWVPFEVNAFEAGVYWDWRVAGIPATGHRVAPVGPNRCRLTFCMPFWAAAYGLVCHRALVRIDHMVRTMDCKNGSQ